MTYIGQVQIKVTVIADPTRLRHRTTIVVLSCVVAVLAVVATTLGLLGSGGDGPFDFVSVRGETVEILGEGMYQHDSVLVGAGNRGVDVVTLALGVPLLLLFLVGAARGSVRSVALLAAIHAYFARVYASQAIGTAYNDLFIVHVALLGASLFATVLLVMGLWPGDDVDLDRLPRKGVASVLMATAALTLLLWLETPITALIQNAPPATLDHYTTLETHALDLAIIVPLLAVAGWLVARGRGEGSVLALPVLGIVAMLAPALTAMTASQVDAGVDLTAGEIVAYVAGFVLLGLAAVWALGRIVGAIPRVGERG